jgi:hypothetical protein
VVELLTRCGEFEARRCQDIVVVFENRSRFDGKFRQVLELLTSCDDLWASYR